VLCVGLEDGRKVQEVIHYEACSSYSQPFISQIMKIYTKYIQKQGCQIRKSMEKEPLKNLKILSAINIITVLETDSLWTVQNIHVN
jgi:hypothetical protein